LKKVRGDEGTSTYNFYKSTISGSPMWQKYHCVQTRSLGVLQPCEKRPKVLCLEQCGDTLYKKKQQRNPTRSDKTETSAAALQTTVGQIKSFQ